VLRNYRVRPQSGDSANISLGRRTAGRGHAAPSSVENGAVTLDTGDIERLLASGGARQVEVGDDPDQSGDGRQPAGEMPFTHLDHALQVAAVLREQAPHDPELAVAGLVHDIGHLLSGVGDAEHAEAGAAAVRAALGDRVAGLVGLHVAAKRYLVARQEAYGGSLAADSVASLALQGGPMSRDEQAAFEQLPLFQDAILLRQADESGKVVGLVVSGLADWMPIVRRQATSPPD
jgi:predicted HD phosphohydrolase